jgi:hypothetical protein
MAREIIMSTWCDPCIANGERAEGEEFIVRVGVKKSDKPRIIALCEVHQKEMLAPVLDILKGAPVHDEDAPVPAQATLPGMPKDKPAKIDQPAASARPGFMGPTLEAAALPTDIPHPVTKDDGEQIWSCNEKECKGKPDTTWSNRDRKRPFQSLRLHMRQLHGWEV